MYEFNITTDIIRQGTGTMMSPACILTNGKLDHIDAKTAHGLIRGTDRYEIVGVVDAEHAGRDAGEVLDGRPRNIMVYSSIGDLLDKSAVKPASAIIGVALSGHAPTRGSF